MRCVSVRNCVLLPLPAFSGLIRAQTSEAQSLKLAAPSIKGGLPVMEALSIRAPATSWSDKELSPRDLSDLLRAAKGINRPDNKHPASSAMNARDVDIYVFVRAGVYICDAASA